MLKKSYQRRIEDGAELAVRLADFTGKTKRKLLSGVLSSAAVFVLLFFEIDDLVGAFVLALAAATLLLFFHSPANTRRLIRKNYKRQNADRFSSGQSNMAEYKLTDEQLIYQTADQEIGFEIRFPLTDVTSIHEDDQYVEVAFGEKGISVIPSRIFDSEQEKQTWIDFITQRAPLLGKA